MTRVFTTASGITVPEPERIENAAPIRKTRRGMTPRARCHLRAWVQAPILLAITAMAALADPHPAITTFNKWCFKAGQTETQARANMNADTAPFTLAFWDDSLEPRPSDAPKGVERRCEVLFDGNHTKTAIAALRAQMATPPKFGTPIPLPKTHAATDTSALIEGRELLRGRVAVVHIGTRQTQGSTRTFMAVDRLYAGLGLPEDG